MKCCEYGTDEKMKSYQIDTAADVLSSFRSVAGRSDANADGGLANGGLADVTVDTLRLPVSNPGPGMESMKIFKKLSFADA